jgi:hypothetical protein
MLMRPPKDSLPVTLPGGAGLLALTPIYGAKAAGGGLWEKLWRLLHDLGLAEYFACEALYHFHNGTRRILIIGTRVYDLIWANEPEAQFIVDSIKRQLRLGNEEANSFVFCGKEFEQKLDDYSVKAICAATTKKLGLVTIPGVTSIRRKMLADPTPFGRDVREQMVSGAGSLSLIARSYRPDLCVHASKIQQIRRKPTYAAVRYANEVIEETKATSDRGLVFKPLLDWNSMIVCAVADAWHVDSTEWIEEGIARG